MTTTRETKTGRQDPQQGNTPKKPSASTRRHQSPRRPATVLVPGLGTRRRLLPDGAFPLGADGGPPGFGSPAGGELQGAPLYPPQPHPARSVTALRQPLAEARVQPKRLGAMASGPLRPRTDPRRPTSRGRKRPQLATPPGHRPRGSRRAGEDPPWRAPRPWRRSLGGAHQRAPRDACSAPPAATTEDSSMASCLGPWR